MSAAVGIVPKRVVVQQRKRLFRVGISQLLSAQDDVEVVATATTDADLVRACRDQRPSVALIEADVTDWDPLRVVYVLRRALPALSVVGLTAAPSTFQETSRARRSGMHALVSREQGISGILEAVHARPDRIGTSSRSVSSTCRTALTSRELEVLSLVGAGLTSNRVSNRLNISQKTVENHKQRIFAKLGVQNQAHAVSIAMRTGLLRSDRVADLAVGN